MTRKPLISNTPRTDAAWAKCAVIMHEGRAVEFYAEPLHSACVRLELDSAELLEAAMRASKAMWNAINSLPLSGNEARLAHLKDGVQAIDAAIAKAEGHAAGKSE